MDKDVILVMISKFVPILLNKNVKEVIIVHIDMFINRVLILIWGSVFKGVVVNLNILFVNYVGIICMDIVKKVLNVVIIIQKYLLIKILKIQEYFFKNFLKIH
jgi:hypothetical protein